MNGHVNLMVENIVQNKNGIIKGVNVNAKKQ